MNDEDEENDHGAVPHLERRTAEGSQMWIMASIPGEAAKMIMKEAR